MILCYELLVCAENACLIVLGMFRNVGLWWYVIACQFHCLTFPENEVCEPLIDYEAFHNRLYSLWWQGHISLEPLIDYPSFSNRLMQGLTHKKEKLKHLID